MTQAQRSARAYLKRKHIAQAELAGATILDPTLVAIDPSDGHYVVRTYDGETLHLVLREAVARPTPEAAPVDEVAAHRQKKVYAPRSWDAEKWNRVVEQLKSRDFSKEEARSEIAQGKTLDDKQKRHALAVIDAVPDVPDWYAHLPLAEES